MNNEEQKNNCPQCGNILTTEGKCPNCGYIKPIESNNTNEIKEEPPKKGGIGKAILRIVLFNIITLAVVFVVLALIYYGGGEANKPVYFLAIIITLAYFVYRIFYKVRGLINKIKLAKTVVDDPKGAVECLKLGIKEHKKAIVVVIILVILYFIPVIFPNEENKKNILTKSSIEEKVIFYNGNITIMQKNISFNEDNVKISLGITSTDGNELTCHQLSNPRVNKYLLNYNFATTEFDKKTGDCIITINKEQLDKYEIEDIYMIDLWLNNNIVTIKTNSSKTKNDKALYVKEDDYKIYENDYFSLYFTTGEGGEFNIFVESKIKEDYTLQINNIDMEGFNPNGHFGTELYDYTIYKNTQGYDQCSDSLSYFKAKYIIYDKDQNVIAEDTIDKEFDKPLLVGNCEDS